MSHARCKFSIHFIVYILTVIITLVYTKIMFFFRVVDLCQNCFCIWPSQMSLCFTENIVLLIFESRIKYIQCTPRKTKHNKILLYEKNMTCVISLTKDHSIMKWLFSAFWSGCSLFDKFPISIIMLYQSFSVPFYKIKN